MINVDLKIEITKRGLLEEGSLNYLFDANYNQDTGILKLIHRNGSTIELRIPIHGLVSEIKYDRY